MWRIILEKLPVNWPLLSVCSQSLEMVEYSHQTLRPLRVCECNLELHRHE